MNTLHRTQVAKEDRLQRKSPLFIVELSFSSIDGLGGIRKEHLQGTSRPCRFVSLGIRESTCKGQLWLGESLCTPI